MKNKLLKLHDCGPLVVCDFASNVPFVAPSHSVVISCGLHPCTQRESMSSESIARQALMVTRKCAEYLRF
jgi:hypothetical protein